MKARNLKEGHVLVDPEGHLYEVTAVVKNLPDAVYAWLWPDSSPVPNYFQTFDPDDDIVGINSSPKPVSSTEETMIIPFVNVPWTEEDDNSGSDAS